MSLQAPAWFDNSWSSASAPGQDVATATANNSTGTDGWGGFFQGLVSQGLNYAIQRDAAKNNLTSSPQGQPVVYQMGPMPAPVPASSFGGVPPLVLLGGLGLLAFVALKK